MAALIARFDLASMAPARQIMEELRAALVADPAYEHIGELTEQPHAYQLRCKGPKFSVTLKKSGTGPHTVHVRGVAAATRAGRVAAVCAGLP